ncbi:hypothetical protein TrVFT333_004640 [Trichoderma virens FT-333]|nr:hypothetical protein TrVFT333_004640 [Trichoderma virens FT-333]
MSEETDVEETDVKETDVEDTDVDMDEEDEGLSSELEAVEDEMEAQEAQETDSEDKYRQRQEILERRQKVLQQMNLPSDLLSGQILGKKVYPQSLVDVTDYRNDIDKAWWHSHCQEMDKAWEEYLEELANILGEETDFDISTLSKPSGPFGAVLHMQWHYPTWKTAGSNFNFGHVMDPGNPSLRQQEKKIGHTPDVCTSDMIPIREDSKYPKWETVFGTAKCRFVLGSSPKEAIYADLVWNAAAAIARIDIASPDHFSWASAKMNTNFAKGIEGSRNSSEKGFLELKRNLEARRKAGFPELKKGRAIMAALGYPNLAKGRQILKDLGHPNLAKAREVMRARGPRQPKEATKALQDKCEAQRLARSRALLRSFDVRYLLRHELSYFNDDDNAKNTYDFFAALRGWPNVWATFGPRRRAGYRQQIRKAHGYFTALRESLEGLRQTRTEDGKRISHTAEQRKFAIWYDKDNHPYGLRWEGDGGPSGGDMDPNIAISIFWHTETRLLRDQNVFAQVIRDAIQRGHTASVSLDDGEDGNSDNGNGSEASFRTANSPQGTSGQEEEEEEEEEEEDGNRAESSPSVPLEIPDSDSDQEDGNRTERRPSLPVEIPDSDFDLEDGNGTQIPTSLPLEIPNSDSDPDLDPPIKP